MSVLALDPGLRLGWCRSDGRNGVLDLSTYADRGEAIALFQRWLSDELALHPTRYLAIERPFFHRASPISDFTSGLIWAAMGTAFLYDVPRHMKPADQVRKVLLGRCRRRRDEPEKEFDAAIRAAVQERGFEPTSEHAADAAALLIVCEDIPMRAAA